MPGVSGVRLRKFLERRLSGVSRKKKNSYSAEKNRSEEHTSELQSQSNLVCRLLLEKKKNKPQAASSARPTQPQSVTHNRQRAEAPARAVPDRLADPQSCQASADRDVDERQAQDLTD